MVDNGVRADWTYGTYLRLDELLALQGDDRGVSNDELHFIVVHQTFELWFKQVVRNFARSGTLWEIQKFLKRRSPHVFTACGGSQRSSD